MICFLQFVLDEDFKIRHIISQSVRFYYIIFNVLLDSFMQFVEWSCLVLLRNISCVSCLFHFGIWSFFVFNQLRRSIFIHQNFFCNSGDRSRRTWKPNVQEKRLFSYVLDRHIRVEVTTHTLRCLDKAGGIDEYLLKTPYHKMDTEMGLYWKSRIEKMYEELGKREVVFFSPEDEAQVRTTS